MRHVSALACAFAFALLASRVAARGLMPASTLKSLAISKFGPLSEAENRLLDAASAGEVAWCGPTRNWDDPANDPSGANGWDASRDIRAALIRWLYVDANALKTVALSGVNVVGARIPDELDFSMIRMDLPLQLRKCAIPNGISLEGAETRFLSFRGSWLGAIHAQGLITHGDLSLRAFHGDGAVNLNFARIGGTLDFIDGVIRKSEVNVVASTIQGNAFFNRVQTDRLISLGLTRIGGNLMFSEAQFKSGEGVSSGLEAIDTSVGGVFSWHKVHQEPSGSTRLDLTFAKVYGLADDEASWPKYILMNEFVYDVFDDNDFTPRDLRRRLEWLGKQPEFRPQPYMQLARIFNAEGNDDLAAQVLIERDRRQRLFAADQRGPFEKFCMLGWSWFLRSAVGYGYEPSRALGLAGFIVAIGWLVFWRGYCAGLIVPSARDAYDALQQSGQVPAYYVNFNSFVYSLETFLPVVDLRQGKYWSTRRTATDERGLFARLLPWYLRFQIMAGWLLSTTLIAGLTGLLHKS